MVSQVDDIPVVRVGRKQFAALLGAIDDCQPVVHEEGCVEADHVWLGCDDGSRCDLG